MFCLQTEFGDPAIYRRILDLVWETLVVQGTPRSTRQPTGEFGRRSTSAEDCNLYGVYPAIDACIALGGTDPFATQRETLEHAIAISETSIRTVAMLEMTQAGKEMTDDELKVLPAVGEWDIQWEIFRLLADCERRDIELIKKGCVLTCEAACVISG